MNSEPRVPHRPTPDIFTISTPLQLSVLASPVRNAIIEVMMERGPSSVAEIATSLDRSPESLYHHLKQLQRIGVVRIAERRKASRRVEKVYEITANDFRIDYTNRSSAFRNALKKTSRTLLRLAEREFSESIDASQSRNATQPHHKIGRDLVHLSDRDLATLHDKLNDLHEWLGTVDHHDAPNHVAPTFILASPQ